MGGRNYSPEEKIAHIEAFKTRTKQFALRVVRLFQNLPKTEEARIMGKQLLRSSTSVAANYRAVCRARSKAEHFAKLSICVEEADETLFWIEMLREAEIVPSGRIQDLENEAEEILSILAKARKNSQ